MAREEGAMQIALFATTVAAEAAAQLGIVPEENDKRDMIRYIDESSEAFYSFVTTVIPERSVSPEILTAAIVGVAALIGESAVRAYLLHPEEEVEGEHRPIVAVPGLFGSGGPSEMN